MRGVGPELRRVRLPGKCFPGSYEKTNASSGLNIIDFSFQIQKTIKQNLHIISKMSTYKTPIRIHVNSTRKVNEKIARYRLPFKKDQPVDDREYSLNYLESEMYKIQSRVNLKNGKEINLEESRVWKNKQSKLASEKGKQEEQEEVRGSESDAKGKQTLGGVQQTLEQPKKMQESTSIHNAEDQSPKEGSVPSRNNLKIISAIKPRIFQQQSQPKKSRYLSVVSQYEEEINFADRSLQSDPEISYKTQRKQEQSQVDSIKQKQDTLPQIKPRRTLHSSLKKQKNQGKIWRILSQQLQKCKVQNLKKDQNKRKKRNSQFKINKFNFRTSEEDNQCLQIQNELKRLNRGKPEIQLSSKQEFYVDLPPIPEDASQNPQMKKKQNGFIERLKEAIEYEQQNKKSKLKFPLEYYVQNYYKIRQINPFFRKLNELGGCILLSIGKFKICESGHQIYSEGQPITHIYLNIVGKIFLTNSHKSFKKFALTGQTLGEESLFEEGKPYGARLVRGSRPMFHRQQARAISKVCLLRIKLHKYYKMSNELCSIGYKNMFNLIDNLFRINYYKKQSLHHDQAKQRIQTQGMLNRRTKVSSQFFY